MVKIKVSAITYLPDSPMCTRVENTLQLLSNNPLFPSPAPDLNTIQNACNALQQLSVESLTGAHAVYALKKTARGSLVELFNALCQYIQYTVGNSPNAEEIILSLGLEVAKTGGKRVSSIGSPFGLISRVSREPAAIDLAWKSDGHGVRAYLVEMADGDNPVTAVFRPLAICTKRKYRAENLMRGKFYTFRVRSAGAGTTCSEPSGTTTCIAG